MLPRFTGWILIVAVLLVAGCREDDDCAVADGPRQEEERWLPHFSVINVGIAATVTIAEDSTLPAASRVRVTSEPNLWYRIQTQVVENTLVIGFSECIESHKDIFIDIRVPNLEGIVISGPALVRTERLIEAENLFVQITGSGDCDLLVEADQIETNISGRGEARFAGYATTHDIRITGAGDVQAYEMPTRTVNIEAAGTGTSFLWVERTLNATVSGRGNVFYRGNPTVAASETGTGRVIEDN